MDYFECKLVEYANRYHARPSMYEGRAHRHAQNDGHPYIRRNPEKCILCGLCVRMCDEVVGAGAIGLAGRGFDTVVQPAFSTPTNLRFAGDPGDADLGDAGCVSCGMCAALCPTGALIETQALAKQVPLKEKFVEAACPHCEIACKVKLAKKGSLHVRVLPAGEGGLLCRKGRFGFDGKTPLPDVPEDIEQRYLERIARANGFTP